MPTVAVFLPRALFFSRPRAPPPVPALVARRRFHQFPLPRPALPSRSRPLVLVASSSGASFDDQRSHGMSRSRTSKKSVLLNLVQEIEPLDLSLIQKDVPANTVDAMKRTISGMLGLLPSDQFHVLIGASWQPLFKLLISSMKTGYTLRGAEYRLYLEKNLGIVNEHTEKEKEETTEDNDPEMLLDRSPTISSPLKRNDTNCCHEENNKESFENIGFTNLGGLTPEVQEYICYLQSRLNFAEKELHDIKRRNSALQMQQFVGEEKNDLLDYLRSLQPEKVAELSEPTCPGVDETIHSVVHGLLATLSPKMHSKPPHHPENPTGGPLGVGQDDCAELVENTSIQFQPLISVPRDYLARLLFWCMLLGHYIRGLEYRIELMELLMVSSEAEATLHEGDAIA